jgi:hypothetical protein
LIWDTVLGQKLLLTAFPTRCLFRRFRPSNPEEVGRLFRLKPAT